MNTLGKVAALAAVTAGLSLLPSPVAQAEEPCTDAGRDCVIATAKTYLDALVSHDVESVRLHPDVWRMGNGRVDARGEDELRAVIDNEPVKRYETVRWIVQGTDAVAVYDLDTDASRALQSEVFAPDEADIPAYIGERFRVVDGLITQIEVVYFGKPGDRPARPYRHTAGAPPCTGGGNACVQTVAESYIDALVSHDASQVSLAEDAWRLENGMNTGEGGEDIRGGVEGSQMNVIVEATDRRWFVEGDQAVVLYLLWSDGKGFVDEPNGPEALRTPTYIVERFRVENSQIKEIEAVFWINPPGTAPDARPS